MTTTVTFTLTEQDYVAAVQAHYLRLIMSRRSLVGGAILVVAFGVGLFAIWSSHGADPYCALYQGLRAGVFAAILLALVRFVGYFSTVSMMRRIVRQQKSACGEKEISWSDDALDGRSKYGDFSFPWTDLHGWSSERIGYLFYLNDYQYYILPRRALTAVQEQDLERTVAASGLPIR